MPKLSVGAIAVTQNAQKTAAVVLFGQPAPTPPPPAETFYLVTDNSDPLITDTNDNLTYGT